ncbi:F-box protein At3g22350-like [Abrus precatorius]|uniref:F-box protein At3g22350-like n=1 Tax=Abrus precatorius TaxID=3816 RepID=A0A8B8KVH1_ABRPR|nr:F-box protein At3g22350-like [Abrus precatorius]
MVVTLSEDLTEDILERLPTKSLMRFKSVKQSWNTLFKSNTFIKRHSQRQRQRASIERVMIFDTCSQESITRLTLLSSNAPVLFELPVEQYPFGQYSSDLIYPMGHCNGIFCLWYNDGNPGFVLWNPATREAKHVPPSPFSNSLNISYYFGFGSNPNTFNCFKLIHVFCMFPNDDTKAKPMFFTELYNTSADSWTVIRDVDPCFFTLPRNLLPFRSSAFVNGIDYSLFFDYTFILCFDFCSNRFWKLDTPTLNGKILEAEDSIAYIVQHTVSEDQGQIGYEIWILEQENTWTKIRDIHPLDSDVEIYALWRDCTECLAGTEYQPLMSYNSDGQTLQQFEYIVPQYREFYNYKYVESIAFLSP